MSRFTKLETELLFCTHADHLKEKRMTDGNEMNSREAAVAATASETGAATATAAAAREAAALAMGTQTGIAAAEASAAREVAAAALAGALLPRLAALLLRQLLPPQQRKLEWPAECSWVF